jgi:DnaJ-class molecular chaperone
MIKEKKCEWCKGSGKFDRGVDGYRDCRRCNGKGLRPLDKDELRDIKIKEILK